MKILVVEDEPGMMEIISEALQQEQYLVEQASDYNSALYKVMSYEYDCIILDITLPGGSGLDILQKLKEEKKTDSVLIVSAKDSVDDKVLGLQLGADDYLPKPFHQAELIARTKAILRRLHPGQTRSFSAGDLLIDPDNRRAEVKGSELQLNRKEFETLVYLVINKGRLVNRSALAEKVWGDHIDSADSFDFIYSQIKNLRKKLKEAGSSVKIEAVYGIGYRIMADETA